MNINRFLQPPRRIHYLKELPFHLDKKALERLRIAGQFLGIILLTAFVAYIFLVNIMPFGITVHYNLQQNDKAISPLGPKNRVKIESINGQNIFHQTHDLIYFTTKMPFAFDDATVKITYRNPSDDQTIALGFRDQNTWHYDTKPMDIPFFNNLSWSAIGTSPPILYQRNQTFGTVENFLTNPPKNALIGTYAYDTAIGSTAPTMQDYKPSTTGTIIDTPLRGKHTFSVYLKKEPFRITIEKQDLNWYDDPDPVTVNVYKDQDLVYQVIADDDGIIDNSQKTLAPQEITIQNPGPDLPEDGIYKIVIDANADTIIKKITTNLHKIVFSGSLFPAGNSQSYGTVISSTSATTFYTNALLLSATSFHETGLQTITVGNQVVPITRVKNTYPITPKDDITKVSIPNGDIVLNGFQGYFAFSEDQFFEPTKYHILPITSKDDVNLVDYIIADYFPPQKIEDWQIAERTFDIRSAFIKNGTLSWLIMAPHLKENNHEILIGNIDVTFHKKPWIN